MLGRFDNDALAGGWRIAYACLLRDDGCEQLPRAIELAEQADQQHSGTKMAGWGKVVLAMARYRGGDIEAASEACDAALQEPHVVRDATALSIKALAQHKLGRRAEAKSMLEQARVVLQKMPSNDHIPVDRFWFFDRGVAQVWYQEALQNVPAN